MSKDLTKELDTAVEVALGVEGVEGVDGVIETPNPLTHRGEKSPHKKSGRGKESSSESVLYSIIHDTVEDQRGGNNRPYLEESSVFEASLRKEMASAELAYSTLEAESVAIRDNAEKESAMILKKAECEIRARAHRMADLNRTINGASTALEAMSLSDGSEGIVSKALGSKASTTPSEE